MLARAEVRGVGSRKSGGSTGGTWGLDEKRVRFEPSARIIPDTWFAVLAEGARFPSREAEERIKSQLFGPMIQDVAWGVGTRSQRGDEDRNGRGNGMRIGGRQRARGREGGRRYSHRRCNVRAGGNRKGGGFVRRGERKESTRLNELWKTS